MNKFYRSSLRLLASTALLATGILNGANAQTRIEPVTPSVVGSSPTTAGASAGLGINNNSFNEVLYTPAEVGGPGKITAITLFPDYRHNVLAQTYNDVQIYIKDTTASFLGSIVATTRVGTRIRSYNNGVPNWQGNITVPASNGVQAPITITLTTPFDYDGTKSVMVAIVRNSNQSITNVTRWQTLPFGNNSNQFGHRMLSQAAALNYNADASGTNLAAGTQTLYRTKVAFTLDNTNYGTACSSAPTLTSTPVVTAVRGGSNVILSQAQAAPTRGVTYQWQRSIDNNVFADVSGANQPVVDITRPESGYYYRLQATCSAGGVTTSPAVFVSEIGNPLTDGFDRGVAAGFIFGAGNSPLSPGWRSINANNDAVAFNSQTYGLDRSGATGTSNSAHLDLSSVAGNDYLVTTGYRLVAGRSYTIGIYTQANSSLLGSTPAGSASVRVGTTPTAAGLTTVLGSIVVNGGNVWGSNQTVNFTPSSTGVYYFAYYVNTGASVPGSIYFFDDFNISAQVQRDLVVALETPTVFGSCRGAADAVNVRVTNQGTSSIDFFTTPLSVTVNISGAGTGSLSQTFSSGVLAAGASAVYPIGTFDFTATGTYTLAGAVASAGDDISSNNNFSVTRSRVATLAPTAASPYQVNNSASSFSVTQLRGAGKNWAASATVTSTSSPVVGLAPARNQTVALAFNGGSFNDQAISRLSSPCINLSNLDQPRLRLYYFQEPSFTNPDRLKVLISTNNGSSFDTLAVIARQNSTFPSGGGWDSTTFNLNAYVGQNVVLAFDAWSYSSRPQAISFIEVFNAPPIPDLQLTYVSPAALGCFPSATPITVKLANQGNVTVDFASTPAQVIFAITPPAGGGSVVRDTVNITSGTLTAGGEMNVSTSQPYAFNAFSTHSIAAKVTSVTGEVNTGNNTMSTVGRVVTWAGSSLPASINFSAYNGTNLFPSGTTAHPLWAERSGVNPTNIDGAWTVGNLNGQNTAVVTMSGTTIDHWIVAPKITATATTKVFFDLAQTKAGSTSPTTSGIAATDDQFRVAISTNCGASFATIYSITAASTVNLSNVLRTFQVDLSAYAGQDVIVGFYATTGSSADAGKTYDLHLDNIAIRNTDNIDLGISRLVAPTYQGCFSSNAQPVQVVITNYGRTSWPAGTPVPVTVNVTGAGTATINGSYVGPAIPAGGEVTYTVGTLDMSTPGTYVIQAATNVGSDAFAANNGMSNAVNAQSPSATSVSPTPFSDNFNSYTANTVPTGWSADSDGDDFKVQTRNGEKMLSTNVYNTNISSTTNSITLGPVAADATIKFDYRARNWTGTFATETAHVFLAGASFKVNLSTDCGQTFSTINTITTANHITSLNMATVSVPVPAAYTGKLVTVQFEVTWAGGDWILDIDNLSFGCDPTVAVWKGVNSDWNDAANWSACTGVPSAATAVSIPNTTIKPVLTTAATVASLSIAQGGGLVINGAGALTVAGAYDNKGTVSGNSANGLTLTAGAPVTITGTATVGALNITNATAATVSSGTTTAGVVNVSSGSLTIASGATLRVTDSLSIAPGQTVTNNGSVVLVSTAARTGRLGVLSAAGSYTGTLTQQRYLDRSLGLNTGAYFFVSPPVTGFTLLGFNSAGNTISGLPNGPSATGNASIWKYDPNLNNQYQGWYVPASALQALNPGDGARVFFRRGLFELSNGVFPFTGQPAKGVGAGIALPTTFCASGCPVADGNGLNLVGNPLPSPIDFERINRTDVDNFFAIWDQISLNYRYYTNGIGTLGATNELATAQGFFIRASAPGASATVTESAKISSNVGVKSNNRNLSLIRLFVSDAQNLTDEAVVAFRRGATTGYDSEFDAPKLPSSGLNIATLGGTELLAISSREELANANDIVNVMVQATAGNYSLRLADLNTMPAGTAIYLVDKYLNTTVQVSNNMVVNFSVNSDPASAGQRFDLVVAPAGATSVKAVAGGQAFRVFPNPSNGSNLQYIMSGYAAGNYTVVITDVVGRVISSEAAVMGANGTALKVNLPKGVYNVVLNGDDVRETRRIVVQ